MQIVNLPSVSIMILIWCHVFGEIVVGQVILPPQLIVRASCGHHDPSHK